MTDIPMHNNRRGSRHRVQNIDLTSGQRDAVARILGEHVPTCEVRAFGSRVAGTTKPYSDLDLAIVGDGELAPDVIRRLREAFEESDLPFRVDVLDWHATSAEFQTVIERHYAVIQTSVPSGHSIV